MNIVIVGARSVGGTLAKKWGAHGHSIYFGIRDTSKPLIKNLARDIGPHASLHSLRDAADKADVICLATPWSNTEEAVISSARLLEPYALLWIASAYKFGLGRDFAFGLLRNQR